MLCRICVSCVIIQSGITQLLFSGGSAARVHLPVSDVFPPLCPAVSTSLYNKEDTMESQYRREGMLGYDSALDGEAFLQVRYTPRSDLFPFYMSRKK